MLRDKKILFIILSILILTGCGQETKLDPNDQADTEFPDVAVSEVKGVDMKVQVDAWEGDASIEEKITPLRVIIVNTSGKPLRIRYNDFALISPEGERYSALPPFKVEGSVEKPTLAKDYPSISAPLIKYENFMISPYYSTIYPSMSAYTYQYSYNPIYYQRYYEMWRDLELPTAEMLQNALPDGVLQDDGRLSGFLFFQKVNPEAETVRFRADLVNAENENIFGTITIPFKVKE